MANLSYIVVARDSSASPPGTPLTGLTPTWVFLKKLSDGTNLTPPPIAEVGYGQYKIVFDPEANGDASGQVDFGATVTNPSDRFADAVFLASDSRTTFNLDAAVSSRSTYTGGAVASVTAPVAVGSIGAGAIATSTFAPGAIDATILAQSAADRVWATSTRALTAFGFNVMSGSPVTVGGYAAGMDPATQVLARPGQPIVTDATGRVTVGTNQDKSNYVLAPAGLDGIAVEAGINVRQALAPILASAAGVLIGAGSGTILIKGANATVTRIVASTDNAGNRSLVTLTLPT